jgi:hypothetical protein
VFDPGKPFQPRLVFAGKVGAYPSEGPYPQTLPETKTLAYYGNP